MKTLSTLILATIIAIGLAQPVEVEHAVGYSDSYGANVMGVIHNTGSTPLEYVQIVTSVYAEGGTFLDSGYTFTMLDTILPGEWSPFEVSIRDAGDFQTFDYQTQWQETSDRPNRVLEVLDHRGAQDGSYFSISGQVRNTGSNAVEYAQIMAALYDAQDNLVGVGYTFTRLDVLQAGSVSPFELNVRGPLRSVARYELVTQSQPVR